MDEFDKRKELHQDCSGIFQIHKQQEAFKYVTEGIKQPTSSLGNNKCTFHLDDMASTFSFTVQIPSDNF